jgi:hypothetical protein
MSGVLLASFSDFSSAPGILIILVATSLLLSLRAWSGTVGFSLTRPVSIMLDVVIALLVIIFLLLVIIRFQTLA